MLFSCAGGAQSDSSGTGDRQQSDDLVFENPDHQRDMDPEVMDLLRLWEDMIRSRNHDLFADVIVESTIFVFQEYSGQITEFTGAPAISEFRLEYFRELGEPEDYHLGIVNEYHYDPDDGSGFIRFHYPESEIIETFTCEKLDGRLRFTNLQLSLPQPGPIWVTSAYHALTDWNQDAFLNDEELGELEELTRRFAEGPHEVSSPVDEFFDWDGDGYIDEEQLAGATGWIAFEVCPYWFRYIPDRGEGDYMWELLDANRDGAIDDEDSSILHSLMLHQLHDPRPVETPVDEWLDLNRDGKLDIEEIQDRWNEIVSLPSHIIFPESLGLPVPREVSNLLDEFADANGNGMIDQAEHEIIIMHSGMFQEVTTAFQEALDRNRNGFIEWYESLMALQASAMGRGMVAEGAEPPYEVSTEIDRFLDTDGNATVDAREINLAVLALSGDLNSIDMLSPSLRPAFDWNDDGIVEEWDIEKVKEWLIYPRPVNPDDPMDLSFDINGDGFIDPEEMGITAGVTNKGEVPPFDERIAIVRRRSGGQMQAGETPQSASDGNSRSSVPGSEYYRKLGTIQDRKLAVVTLDIGTDKVDEETARGIIVFVENAFVNVGKVKVVDRGHIEEIFDEFEFQATGIIDESTAVEIGKLSGADIIVIGSINRVGGLFYLNIKLITVENAEIIGSSIAQAQDATSFLEMANQAVYKLF